MDIRAKQRAVVEALEDVKGRDILVFNTARMPSMFERVVIASGDSNRQVRALAQAHIEELDEKTCNEFKTEYDVVSALKALGHEVLALGVQDELRPIRLAVEAMQPNIVFNLLEEFHDNVLFDQNVVSYLELLKVPYTGCNPRGMIIARGKALAKKLVAHHRIHTPNFEVFPRGRKPRMREPRPPDSGRNGDPLHRLRPALRRGDSRSSREPR